MQPAPTRISLPVSLPLLIILLLSVRMTSGQPGAMLYGDVGQNNLSEKVYGNAALLLEYRYRDEYRASTGFLWHFTEETGKLFQGFNAELSWMYGPKGKPWHLTLFYRMNPTSELLRETNAGLYAGRQKTHFAWDFGLHTRMYGLTPEGRKQQGISKGKESRIVEGMNFMYSAKGFVKPYGHPWNLSGAITTFDPFLLMQENNPMVMAGYTKQLGEEWSLFAELWYKSAGMMNIRVNYFGYHIRTGVLWQIK